MLASRPGTSVDFTVLIPARYASTRLPGKPLADLGGRPMVVHVAERARASGARGVIVATDDARIADAAKAHGFDALITRPDHATGTDRLAEAAALLGLQDDEIVVNVQGDEPLLDAAVIRGVAEALRDVPDAAIATACHPLASAAEFFSPNIVKVVCDQRGSALYFSRAPIPFARDDFRCSTEVLPAGLPAYRHIGLYAYRASFLAKYPTLTKTALEQLRALAHGYRIIVEVLPGPLPPGVDTEHDLTEVRRLFEQAANSGTMQGTSR